MKNKSVIKIILSALNSTIKHDGIEFSGYLAYLWLLSLLPILFIYTAILGELTLLMADEHAYHNITQNLIMMFDQHIPSNIIRGIMPFIQEIILGPSHSLITIVIVIAIWTSSSTIEGMRTIFNRAYRVKQSPHYIWGRIMSIFHFLIIALISIILLIVLNIMPIYANTPILSNLSNMKEYFKYLYTVITLFSILCWLYMMIPNIKQNLKSVLPGAILVTILWITTAYLFSLYIEFFAEVNIIYGSFAGIIIALVFFYIMNLCLIFGAEFNYVFAQQYRAQ